MKKQKNFKSQGGITLVALIITIIVLVILAAVAINVALNTGIINFATKGVTDYAEAGVDENRVMNKTIDFMTNTVDKIEGILGETGGTGGGSGGSGGGKTTLAEAKKKDTPFTKTTEVKDGNKSMWVPAGFKITEGDSIDTGIVVQDREENEFVWVPVEDPSTMYGTDKDGNKLGKLYDFTKNVPENLNWTETEENGKKVMKWTSMTENNSNREPDIVTRYDTETNLSKYIQAGLTPEAFKKQLQDEFNSMIASVEKYKGFYIGRYETSNLGTATPEVKKEKTNLTYINWYNAYKNSKEIAKVGLDENENPSVTSSMIWGCQWDSVMNWFLNCGGETAAYVTNSTGKGNYTGGIKATGSNSSYEVNRIYDMGGNILEWTLEVYDKINDRVLRGGFTDKTGLTQPACYRDYYIDSYRYPTASSFGIGSRATLYINL